MKRVLFVLLFMVVMCISACSSKGKSTLTDQKLLVSTYGELQNTIETQNMKIEMKTEKHIYKKSNTIKLRIENKGDKNINFGLHYQLEVYDTGSWYEVPFTDGGDFAMVGVVLKPNSIHYDLIEFENFMYDLTPGKYRIVKSFGIDRSKTTLGTEFYLK